ncbi:MAG TPA: hypothetical protein VFV38_50770 [Ktedonobacteraceae bacterium]|nr:hypothetical protein [Ktedonobacteraceae bacterium]
MEDYYIVLSPDLGLSPEEFIASWNEGEECREKAVARLVSPSNQQYDIGLFAEILLSLVTNMASSAVYDLIKKALTKRESSSKHLHIEALRKPDGTNFIVVDIDEK